MPNTDPYGADLARPGPTVLVVDDVEANADAFAAMLRGAYHVTAARSVNDALADLAQSPHGYLACVLDLSLDAPSARLHDPLERLDVPVVLDAAGRAAGVEWLADAAVWVTAIGLPLAGPVLASRSL